MQIYFFVHLTGRDTGNTGIQRVVRNLGRALQFLPDIELIPVRWCPLGNSVVHAEPEFLEVMALFGGPRFATDHPHGQPIREAGVGLASGDWLLIPEVPHLSSADERYPSVNLPPVIGYARRHGLGCATIFHDLLPLTHPEADAADERVQLRFTVYGQALASADLVMPVSVATGESLTSWWHRNGFRAQNLPRIAPVTLAEEVVGWPRELASGSWAFQQDRIEFVTFGTVCARKNQIRAVEAFNRVCQRRPELDLRFHIVGHVDPAVASALARQVARSAGRVQMLGYLRDDRLVELIGRARATVFVSLAEGFGLPVAESLWRGKPCLCSNIGSVAEIAAGGGCLSVDPNDAADIERGFDRICTDRQLYATLLDQLRVRRFKKWDEYAAEVAGELSSFAP